MFRIRFYRTIWCTLLLLVLTSKAAVNLFDSCSNVIASNVPSPLNNRAGIMCDHWTMQKDREEDDFAYITSDGTETFICASTTTTTEIRAFNILSKLSAFTANS